MQLHRNIGVFIPSAASHPVTTCIPRLLFVFLRWSGLVEEPKKQYKLRKTWIFLCCMVLLAWSHTLAGYIIYFEAHRTGQILAYLLIMPCSIVIWYTIQQKRKRLMTLMRKLQIMYSSNHVKTSQCFAFIIFGLPLIYCIALFFCFFTTRSHIGIFDKTLTSPLVRTMFICIVRCLQFFCFPTFHCVIALLYCILCLRCTTLIRKLAQEINMCSPESFGPGDQFSILRRKSEIDCILDIIQDIFSLPSFFIVLSSFLSLYRVLAFNLTSRVIHYSSLTATVSLFYGVTGFFCFTSILWVAGGVPVELNKLKEKFYKKVHLRFIVLAITKEPKYKQEILEAPEFVLTGCGILSYRRSSILTLVGTLLTYTVLIINTI
ncbi:uncharacterized protein NPIL_572391 [Nephila pilipes]|uniref:Uncharacterized protein n=1 Tax=Nephila pilipes TaxID=299642 RepID=A0A8X6QVV3_NEPPI|nr:uncharacterized protein NPIL_572391 [Nephila pilipes]